MWVPQKHYKTAGAVLASARNRANLSQQELATRLKKPQSFVSAYESGQRRIDVLELLRIVEALQGDAAAVFAEIQAKAKR